MNFMHYVENNGVFTTPALAEEYRRNWFLDTGMELQSTLMMQVDPKHEIKWAMEVIWNILEEKIVHAELRHRTTNRIDVPLWHKQGELIPNLFSYVSMINDAREIGRNLKKYFASLKLVYTEEGFMMKVA